MSFLLVPGCGTISKSIGYAVVADEMDMRFTATQTDWNLTFGSRRRWFTGAEYNSGWFLLYLPITVVSLSFSIITDSVTYPLDYYLYKNKLVLPTTPDNDVNLQPQE